jgi:hypothetical protein
VLLHSLAAVRISDRALLVGGVVGCLHQESYQAVLCSGCLALHLTGFGTLLEFSTRCGLVNRMPIHC